MNIIGLGRRKSVGKDTLASMIRDQLPDSLDVEIVGIADKMKQMSFEMFGWAGLKPSHYYEGDGYGERDIVLPAIGKSARQIWIEFGTLVGRSLYPDTWIKEMLDRCRFCDVLIIKDVRFLNEVRILKDLGALLIEVENPRIPTPTDIADTQDLGNWYEVKVINDDSKGKLYDDAGHIASFIHRGEVDPAAIDKILGQS
jgi:hypothetical protein